ncbi:helix-turn-helix domain-containing protein [Pelosinus propionicus]|uniref:DNA binding domain-containing protein, excisionase family n=1 Tax=Pelosinus propionicus DSM 13327 TaxID=1123291 RepID=A0A1I4QG32_9FIRM|nr:helix-turn-helix domain-containing protein [Pelosinus propionicus]SFM38610.1 DNA binding domain-containing protein, excisionase family [Pelosinus propionicus DSM 13327]
MINTALNTEIEKVYTVSEIAELLKLHPVTVRRFIRAKKINAVKMGKDWRVYESDLVKYYDTYLKPVTN